MPRIASIQVGLPQTYGSPDAVNPHNRLWTTGFFKQPVIGQVWVEWENLQGDGQADLRVHGGIDKAVMAYSGDHYPAWQAELGLDSIPGGAFGENLTIAGLTETGVCLGDVWQAGSVRLQVSQPRQPCWKLGRRWQNNLLPKLVVKSGRSGWYFRVVETGEIEAGTELILVDRPHPQWTIARANEAMYQGAAAVDLMELASLPEVSRAWIKDLPG